MSERIEIKGGANEFDAAVIAAVITQLAREEATATQKRGKRKPGLSAWVRALAQERPGRPRDQVWPE